MELMKLLPDYYEKNVTMETFLSIVSDVTKILEGDLTDTVGQCFVSSATEYLDRWERMLGIEEDASKTVEFRRERIHAKISGIGTTTKAMLMDVASRYSNGAVEVYEDYSHYRFTIKFVGTVGIPGNMDSLKLSIEEIKPAHLEVLYEYVYNVWADVRGLTWGQAGQRTWQDMRTVKA